MKKRLTIFLCMIFALAALSACGTDTAAADDTAPLRIVATIFPEYDWVKNILGDNPAGAELTLLLDSGVDLHSYQPSAADMLLIADCDLFIYVGGESDAWVDDALAQEAAPGRIVIDLLASIGELAKEEELVEGMEAGEEEEASGDEAEYDEHVWLSLRNASILCKEIEQALAILDPDNSAVYARNLSAYDALLSALDTEYTQAVAASSRDTLLFGDRFPFRYMFDDYGLRYYAAFSGCSAECEASFETVLFLAQKLDELKLAHVMVIEGSDAGIADTIIENTENKDQKILRLNSLQAVTAAEVDAGADYLSAMRDNINVLKEALQ